jgi:hypothetical protein
LQHSTWDGSRQVYDFSSWEGQVWRFSFTGGDIERVPIARQGLSLYLDQ